VSRGADYDRRVSESNVPGDVDACPRCEATVRADVPLGEAGGGDDPVRTCPECGASLRRQPLGGWILVDGESPEALPGALAVLALDELGEARRPLERRQAGGSRPLLRAHLHPPRGSETGDAPQEAPEQERSERVPAASAVHATNSRAPWRSL